MDTIDTKIESLSLAEAECQPSREQAWYDATNPPGYVHNLIWGPDGHTPEEYQALRAAQGLPAREDCNVQHPREKYTLCWACGWSERDQLLSSYFPRIKIFHTRMNMGIWDLGGRWLLFDQPNNASGGNEVVTQRFLRAQPDWGGIPLMKDMIELTGPNDPLQLTLMTYSAGRPLDLVWEESSATERAGYVTQLADVIRRLRTFTADRPQRVDGRPLDDLKVGYCTRSRALSCTKVGRNTTEWLDAMAPSLRRGLARKLDTRDPAVLDAALDQLRTNLPAEGGPYYLTHGDLNLSNILVLDGKINAIIDWERAGYYPWWAERFLSNGYHHPAEELFDPVWELVEPEMSGDTFDDNIADPVYQVHRVFFYSCDAEHPHENDCWFKPAFSECEPAAGTIEWRDYRDQVEHKVPDMSHPLTGREADQRALDEAKKISGDQEGEEREVAKSG